MYIYGRGKEAENIGERRMEERARRERGTERERERGREEPRRNEGPNVAKPPISVTIYPYRRLVQEMIITSPSPPSPPPFLPRPLSTRIVSFLPSTITRFIRTIRFLRLSRFAVEPVITFLGIIG